MSTSVIAPVFSLRGCLLRRLAAATSWRGVEGPVLPRGVEVASQLAADRRERPAQHLPDHSRAMTPDGHVGDLDSLLLGQKPRGDDADCERLKRRHDIELAIPCGAPPSRSSKCGQSTARSRAHDTQLSATSPLLTTPRPGVASATSAGDLDPLEHDATTSENPFRVVLVAIVAGNHPVAVASFSKRRGQWGDQFTSAGVLHLVHAMSTCQTAGCLRSAFPSVPQNSCRADPLTGGSSPQRHQR